jgi:L-rhamnose mutarotase
MAGSACDVRASNLRNYSIFLRRVENFLLSVRKYHDTRTSKLKIRNYDDGKQQRCSMMSAFVQSTHAASR